MKKLIICILAVFFLMSFSNAFAEGTYDGIWNSPIGFISLHEKNGTLVGINLDSSSMEWEAYQGQLNGNRVTFTTLLGPVQLLENVTFTSTSTATVTQDSCYPLWQGYRCLFQNGTTFQIQKIW